MSPATTQDAIIIGGGINGAASAFFLARAGLRPLIVEALEVNGVERMLYMASKCTNDGQMMLDVTFELGTNLDMAQVLVQNRVGVAEAKLPPPVRTVRADVAVEDLRYRSYPSFTRVVVEAKAPLAYVTVPGSEEIRIRLPRLALDRVRTEEIADGLVKQVRLEPDGDAAAVLRIALEEKAGEIKTFTLQDPFRMVFDIYRQQEAAQRNPVRQVHRRERRKGNERVP